MEGIKMSIVIKGNSIVKGQPIRVYDNGGKTYDRYTVVYMAEPERQAKLFASIGMSEYPFHPQGFGQHGTAMPGKHLGRRILFTALPEDCQRLVNRDLEEASE
jgi:hypothetical protein